MRMKKMLNEGNQIHMIFYTLSVRTFVIPFYYGTVSVPPRPEINLRFRFCYSKKFWLLQFRFRNTDENQRINFTGTAVKSELWVPVFSGGAVEVWQISLVMNTSQCSWS